MTNTPMPECGHARLAVRLLDSSTPSNCPTVSTWQSIVGAMSVGQYLLAETDCNLWFPAQLVIAWHCACSISLPLLSYRHTELFFDGLSIQTCTARLVLPALCAHEDVPDVFWNMSCRARLSVEPMEMMAGKVVRGLLACAIQRLSALMIHHAKEPAWQVNDNRETCGGVPQRETRALFFHKSRICGTHPKAPHRS